MADLAQVASDLIAANGRTVQIVRRITEADPAAPWDEDTSETPIEVSAVFVGTGALQQPPTLNAGTSAEVLIAGLDLEAVTTADTLVDGADTWQITGAELVKPGVTNFLWKLTVAK